MQVQLPSDIVYVLQQLQAAKFQAYIVGGAVRDLLTHQQPTDWDFTTNARPEQILQIFPDAFYENEFGTVAIARQHIFEKLGIDYAETRNYMLSNRKKIIDLTKASKIHQSLIKSKGQRAKGEEAVTTNCQLPTTKSILEITTFRSDQQYLDFRHPSSVSWGNSLQIDLDRRDFTINAMAMQVNISSANSFAIQAGKPSQKLPATSCQLPATILDPHQGQMDLKNKLIKTVGNPNRRFNEDALRMMRAVRFAVQLKFDIAKPTLDAIKRHAFLLKHVSFERIRDELLKILASEHPAEGIELLDATGLLELIIPELIAGKGVRQAGHHTTDVWTHSIDALRFCPASDPIVRLATLLHDVAKPQTQRITANNITFYNHEVVGAHMAKKIARRLKLTKAQVDKIFILVRYHMFYYQPHNTDAAIRRFMRKVGLENIDDILALREGDRLGSGARKTSWRLEEMKQRMIAQLHQPLEIRDLAINGHDLIRELKLQPGPILGKILSKLLEKVMENPQLNTKEKLLTSAVEIVKSNS